jgi:hypothetical protein
VTTQHVPDEVDEEHPRLHVGLHRLAVDGEPDVLGGHGSFASSP